MYIQHNTIYTIHQREVMYFMFIFFIIKTAISAQCETYIAPCHPSNHKVIKKPP